MSNDFENAKIAMSEDVMQAKMVPADRVAEEAIKTIRGVIDDWREAATWAQADRKRIRDELQKALVEARAERDQWREMRRPMVDDELARVTRERDAAREALAQMRRDMERDCKRLLDERDEARERRDELLRTLIAAEKAISMVLQ